MKIGYACLTLGVVDTQLKSCTSKNANEETLTRLIGHNLDSLDHIIDYNIKNGILLFRISSDIIPFGSSPVNTLEWWKLFSDKLWKIGSKLKQSGMRVSMHPGQYTVLNSLDDKVVERAVQDLDYHTRFLDSINAGSDCKLILHIGGAYGNKAEATARFAMNYRKLSDSVRARLVIENDDKLYHIWDVLELGIHEGIPVVFDNLHHQVNPSDKTMSEYQWIDECRKTWTEKDGQQKIHYSQQNLDKKPGSHSGSILYDEFIGFVDTLSRRDIDIMLEVKDKNLSAVKCINATTNEQLIKKLELEWSKYKYKILENSPSDYHAIRKLLMDKEQYPVREFYKLVENALAREHNIGYGVNAAQHVWGYFKALASDHEKAEFTNKLMGYQQGLISIGAVKKYLWRLCEKYDQKYLKDSLYFSL